MLCRIYSGRLFCAAAAAAAANAVGVVRSEAACVAGVDGVREAGGDDDGRDEGGDEPARLRRLGMPQ